MAPLFQPHESPFPYGGGRSFVSIINVSKLLLALAGSDIGLSITTSLFFSAATFGTVSSNLSSVVCTCFLNIWNALVRFSPSTAKS